MHVNTSIIALLSFTLLISQLSFVGPYIRGSIGCLSGPCIVSYLSATVIFTYATVLYVIQLRASDPEWYYPYTEHYLIDVFIAGLWYILFLVCVTVPFYKRRTLKLIVDGLQDVHDSMVALGATPDYVGCRIDTEVILRQLTILTIVTLNYVKLDYNDNFSETWYKLAAYIPMIVLSAVYSQVVAFQAVIGCQLQAIISSFAASNNSVVLEQLVVLTVKLCSVSTGVGNFYRGQLFFAAVHTFACVTSNLYFAVFSITVARDLDGYAVSCVVWATLYIFELWRLLTAFTNVKTHVKQFYYTLYDLTLEDDYSGLTNNVKFGHIHEWGFGFIDTYLFSLHQPLGHILLFSCCHLYLGGGSTFRFTQPNLILYLEKRYRLQFKVGGFLDLDLNLLPPMFGAICTNLVLCVQFQDKIKL